MTIILNINIKTYSTGKSYVKETAIVHKLQYPEMGPLGHEHYRISAETDNT